MNFDEALKELDIMLAQETDKKNQAKEAMDKADKIKEAAAIQEQKSAENEKKISEARAKLEEARATYSEIDNEGEVVVEETTPTNNNNNNNNNHKNHAGRIFIAGLLTGAFIYGLGSCTLTRESKTGTVKLDNTKASVQNSNGLFDGIKRWFNGANYDYEKNEYVDSTYEYNYGKNVTTAERTSGTETSFEINGLANTEYETLTTEKFEELCSHVARKLEGLGIAASREDIIKFVTVYNINKLKQDNPELVKTVMGTQTILEVFDDAATVGDTIMSYEAQNLIYNGKIFSVADVVFDKEQQKLIKDFEAKKLEIVLADQGSREALTEAWLYSLVDAQSEFRLFDDASRLLVLRHCVVPVDSVYFKDSTYHSTLTGNARAYMFQMIAPYGATEEEIMSSVASSTEKNMMDSFKQCVEKEKTYTR